MTTPTELLTLKYGEIPLVHVGDVKVVTVGGHPKELAFYAARVKAGNQVPFNLLIAAVPLNLDDSNKSRTIGQLPWVSVYLRSYFNLKAVQELIPLDWEKLAATEEYSSRPGDLPGGLWLQEIRRADHKSKSYVFREPALASKYLVTVESRLKSSLVGNDLKDSYEFDMLLSHSHYNTAIEKLE
jgi:hypothetical protein